MLSGAMHGMGADVHLSEATVEGEDGGVERLVAVQLGAGDVVTNTFAIGMPEAMDDAEALVALFLRVDQHTERDHVVQLANLDAALTRLQPGAVGMFHTPVDRGGDVAGGQLMLDALAHA